MLAFYRSLFRPRPPQAARDAYIALVAAARNRFFFTTLGVPDTLDGRFETIVLHMFLLQDRLRATQPEFARFVSEVFFDDMDANLRELGVADTGVSYRIKRMGKAYHGRLQAYVDGIARGDDVLKAAFARNLYGTISEGDPALLDAAATYVRRMRELLAATSDDSLVSGAYRWPEAA